MRSGAADFLPKPIGARALIEHLTQMVAQCGPAKKPCPEASPATTIKTDFEGFIGRSQAMHIVYDNIRRIAASRAPVFVTGESGSGKELAAAAIHAGFSRAAGKPLPFVALNCSAIPKDLMESEIFGHVRGAFTGASEARTGAAELAHGGILFLDEIAEMELALQAKLLRFVQTGQFRRVGGEEPVSVEVRIVSATNRDPVAEVAAGRLRADLFHRLYVLPLEMPPLRARGDDILLLAETFLRRFAAEEGRPFGGFSEGAAAALTQHAWPGNVRELANCVRRAVVLGEGPLVTADALVMAAPPDADVAQQPAKAPLPAGTPVAPYWQQERTIIETAVSACGGNVPRAAAALGISPATVYRKRHVWRATGAG
jgi:two-component system repressor protein LuxO